MGFNNNFIDDLNEKLMTKRTPDDIQTTLNIEIEMKEEYNLKLKKKSKKKPINNNI